MSTPKPVELPQWWFPLPMPNTGRRLLEFHSEKKSRKIKNSKGQLIKIRTKKLNLRGYATLGQFYKIYFDLLWSS